jgi:hypothetical protein
VPAVKDEQHDLQPQDVSDLMNDRDLFKAFDLSGMQVGGLAGAAGVCCCCRGRI